jgi:hypothetical protein
MIVMRLTMGLTNFETIVGTRHGLRPGEAQAGTWRSPWLDARDK